MKVFRSSNLVDYKIAAVTLQEIGLKVVKNRLAITTFNRNANHYVHRVNNNYANRF